MPDETKPVAADKPKPTGMIGALVATAPIILTILSTVLSGLSNSELGKANYLRMLAGQKQSKIADQWSFFQARRIRGTTNEDIADTIRIVGRMIGPFESFSPESMKEEIDGLTHSLEQAGAPPAVIARIKVAQKKLDKLAAENQASFAHLSKQTLPVAELGSVAEPEKYKAVSDEIDARKSEKEIAPTLLAVQEEKLLAAIAVVERNQDAFDKVGGAAGKQFSDYAKALDEIAAASRSVGKKGREASTVAEGLVASFKTATLDFDARRYRQEAKLTQVVAQYYEISVRHLGAQAERHRDRSFKFFIAMLISQLGAVVAAMALARFSSNDLWALAAFSAIIAGLIAIAFGAYVYLTT